jgi:serine/threonine protein kinase
MPTSLALEFERIDIGAYRLERRIGQGGMGSIFAARHVNGGPPVALKVLAHALVDCPNAVARFMREARVAAGLKSPHSVRIIEVGTSAPYIVMELLVGRPLAAFVAGGAKIATDEAVDLIAQACDAVSEAHDAGIVHRDLSLSNLFVTRLANGSPFIKVLDFGLAKHVRRDPLANEKSNEVSLTKEGALLGTPHYMSPEQIIGIRDIDERADVWSLGVCLYRLLTGRYPFRGPNFAAICCSVLRGVLTPPRTEQPAISEAVAAIIVRCLARRPEDRYDSARELAVALRASAARPEASRHPFDSETHVGTLPLVGSSPVGQTLAMAPSPAPEPRITPLPSSPVARSLGIRRTTSSRRLCAAVSACVIVGVFAVVSLSACAGRPVARFTTMMRSTLVTALRQSLPLAIAAGLLSVPIVACRSGATEEEESSGAAATAGGDPLPNERIASIVARAQCAAGKGHHEVGTYEPARLDPAARFASLEANDAARGCTHRTYTTSKAAVEAYRAFSQPMSWFGETLADRCTDDRYLKDDLLIIVADPHNTAVFASVPDGAASDDRAPCFYYRFDVMRADGTAARFDFDWSY